MIIPKTIFWEITAECNFNCIHCYLGNKKGETEEFLKETSIDYVDWLCEVGVETVLFMGGEPLIYPYIYDVVRRIGKYGYGLHAGILTNGFLLTSDVITKLKASGASAVQVGIDGINSSYEKIRGINFKVIHENIRRLKENRIRTQAKFTINKRNLDTFDSVWEYCQENKIILSTSLVLKAGNAKDEIIPKPQEYFSLFLKMFKVKEKSKIEGKFFGMPDFSIEEYLTKRQPETGCNAGRSVCGITADNKFVPCIYLSGLNTKKLFGFEPPEFNKEFLTVFNSHPLFELFRLEAAEQFGCPIRKRIYRGKDPFSVYEFAKWFA